MITAAIAMAVGLLVLVFGIMLGLNGENGHPAGIPTIYAGGVIMVFAFAYGLFKLIG